MGNINNQSAQSQLPINFKELSRSQHSILGDIKHIVNNHDENEYALIERVFVSQTEFQKCMKKIKNRSKLGKMKQKYQPNQYIIEVIDYRSIEQSQFCGKTFKLFIFLKNFESDLKTVFQQRKAKNQLYTENQLVQLMLRIVNCLIEMYDHSFRPYHLSMQSILIRKNVLKLIDCDLTNQMNPIDSLNFKSQLRKGTFIAPEMLAQSMQYQSNSSKSDIFTLGMIVLSLMNLKSIDEVYDYNNRKINFSSIESMIEKSLYSQSLKHILKQMLEEYPDERIGILRLKQSLTCLFFGNSQQRSEINNNNNLQQSGHNKSSATTSKGLIYLGKQPLLKNTQFNMANSYTLIHPKHQRKNSYHKLLNDKSINRQKKSISVNEVNHQHSYSSFLKQDKQKSFIKINYKQTPKTNVQLTPNLQKLRDNYIYNNHNNYNVSRQDVSDIKSDTPISPSTLELKDNYINKNYAYHQQKSPYYVENHIQKQQYHQYINNPNSQQSNHYVSTQQQQYYQTYQTVNYKIPSYKNNQSLINNNQIPKTSFNIDTPLVNNNNDPKQDYQLWVQNQKNKLKSYQYQQQQYQQQQSNQLSLQQKVNIPTFSKLTSIDKLQTPRITKKFQFNNNQSKSNKFTSGEKKVSQQTPIKSLQLMRTQKRQQINGHSIKPIQRIQQQKVFGRYDFSNGSVYEGQFNSDNQFQGKFNFLFKGNGVLYFSSGNIFYSGCWKKNQFHGFGILNNIENNKSLKIDQVEINYFNFNLNDNNLWTQYEGEFYQDKKHGFGTLYFINGDKFSGCFVNDSIQGFGNFYRSRDHQTVMGIWVDNLFKQN